jgi:hypothetical protein
MNTRTIGRLSLILVALVAWCLGSASLLLAQSDTTLGSSGELYRARTGAYKDLFPGQKPPAGVDPASSALALDVVLPGAAPQRFLVPGTAGGDVELQPSLLYEDAASTVYLLWERRVNNIHPVLMLTGFSSGSFSTPIELISDSFSDKTHPQIALTRDRYQTQDASGNAVPHSRTVLHILWAQDDSAAVDTFYSPVIFEDGAYIGWNPVYRLNDLDSSSPAAPGYPLSPMLLHSPTLEAGQDGRTVTVGFVSAATQNVLTIELDTLPAALSQIADKARAQIIETGRNKSSLQTIADQARSTVLTQGAAAFRSDVLQAIADALWTKVVNSPNLSLDQLSDSARQQVITTGAEFAGRGLRSFGDNAAAQIAEVNLSQDNGGGAGTQPSQFVQLRVTSSRPTPNVGTGATRLFVSETGERVIASWLDSTGSQVFYRMSDAGAWSNPLVIKLSSSLSLDNAYSILDQRARSH